MTNIQDSQINEPLLNHGHDKYHDDLVQMQEGKDIYRDVKASYVQEGHEFGDLMVHSVIETIEYVLGSISNTASYLRLWALSLAHAELSKVFFDYLPGMVLNDKPSVIALFLVFYMFFLVEFSILMLMDVMEAFLHDIRLHWVEFQGKFYKGEGVAFQEFSLQRDTQVRADD